MMVSLKGLPDTLRGAAWPSSARAVRCPVKPLEIVNSKGAVSQETSETRAASCYYPVRRIGTLAGLPVLNGRKVRATAGLYGPNFRGNTRPTMRGTTGCNPETKMCFDTSCQLGKPIP